MGHLLSKWRRGRRCIHAAGIAASIAGAALFLLWAPVPLAALDLTLNDRSHAVLADSALAAHARPMNAAGGAYAVPLEALYPWLESVDYLEAQSGPNKVYWEAERLGEADWDGALIVERDGIWEVRVGRDVFSAPDRIAVRGVRKEVGPLRIWSAIDDSFESNLKSALALRGVRYEWRRVSQPAHLLTDPPAGGVPHLILLDQMDVLALGAQLTSSRPVAGLASLWFESADTDNKESPAALAMDAYHPEAALLFLLSANPNLFDDEGRLPSDLAGLLSWAAASKGGELVVTDRPMAALAAGRTGSAVRLPSSTEPLPTADMAVRTDPPEGAANIVIWRFASVPAGLGMPDAGWAELLFTDAVRAARRIPAGTPLPMDNRLPRFYDAYERIGRLAISGQMDAEEAADLMQTVIDDE
ncbi:MAG: hypothetical protein P1P77_15870 [Spirochaetaceae bacterium]|nr:hypothetical protein [Spirochaetaceae bacterium]